MSSERELQRALDNAASVIDRSNNMLVNELQLHTQSMFDWLEQFKKIMGEVRVMRKVGEI